MPSKWILTSKTFWFNVISGLTLFLALPELTAVLPTDSVRYLLLTQAGLNIVLRLMSSKEVTVTSPKESV